MTDRKVELAKLIARWHGQKIVQHRAGRNFTYAATRGYASGWGWELDRFVGNHWEEYVPAAEAVLHFMEPDYVG